jgi:hypothetical protein
MRYASNGPASSGLAYQRPRCSVLRKFTSVTRAASRRGNCSSRGGTSLLSRTVTPLD